MASTIQVDKVQDTGGNTILSSNSTGTFTYEAASGANFTNLPVPTSGIAASAIDSGTLAIAQGGTGAATLAAAGLANTPSFFAYKNATQTGVVKNTATKISFQTEVFDSDGDYDNSSNYRFTPTTAGKYLVTASISAKGNVSTTTFICWVYKNGAVYARNNNYASSSECMSTVTTMVDMNGSSDYLEVYIYQGTTGDIEIYSGTEYTWFGATKIIGA